MSNIGNKNTPVPITSDQLQDGLVTSAKIAEGAVTQEKLAEGAIPQGVPSGFIGMWSGSVATIPSGWFLCDGTNDTPNLVDRFIVGAGGTYDPGNTGGATEVTLTEAQMPSHTHTSGDYKTNTQGSHSHSGSTNTTGSHSHSQNTSNDEFASGASGFSVARGTMPGNDGTTGVESNGSHSHSLSINSNGSHDHDVIGTSAPSGGGESHENRPPYYALCYIMKG